MTKKSTPKTGKGKSTPKYKKQILYEYRLSEAWFLIYVLLAMDEIFIVSM
jgi:hypothetical protein